MKSFDHIIIKKAEKSDFPLVAELRHRLWPQDSVAEHQSELQELSEIAPLCDFIAYDTTSDGGYDTDTAVAFAEASIRPYANGCLYRPVAFLEGIWCAYDYQNLGIGAALIAEVEKWGKAQGAKELGSDAYIENETAHSAHEKWGFEMTEKVVYFRKKL